jgi:signal peptidase
MRRTRVLEAAALIVLGGALFLTWPTTLGGRVSYLMVSGHSMVPTMHDGDVAVLRSAASYHVGEIVAYRVPADEVGGGTTVIHRIVGGDARHGFLMRGDGNAYDDVWRPKAGDIVGVRRALLPSAADAFAALRSPLVVALFAAIFGAAIAFRELRALSPRADTRLARPRSRRVDHSHAETHATT